MGNIKHSPIQRECREPKWFVYILQSTVTGRLYTGITTDLDRRLQEHNEGRKGAKATRAGRPWEIVYKTPCGSRSEALKLEARLKRLGRPAKLLLIHCRGTSQGRKPSAQPASDQTPA